MKKNDEGILSWLTSCMSPAASRSFRPTRHSARCPAPEDCGTSNHSRRGTGRSRALVEIRVERQRRDMTVQHQRLQSLFLQRRQHDPRFSQSATAAVDRKPVRHAREPSDGHGGRGVAAAPQVRSAHDVRQPVREPPQCRSSSTSCLQVQQVHHQPPKPILFYARSSQCTSMTIPRGSWFFSR